jgi:hypothetical protein
VATGYIPLPQYRAPSPFDFSGLNQGIEAVGQKLEKNRLLQQQKDIGSAIQSGGYGDGADAAFAQGNVSLGTQLAGVEQSDEDRDFNRNRLLASDKRAAAAEGRSTELHGLNVQKTQEDLRSGLIARTAGIAQRIRNETDPQRKATLVQSFVNAHPKLKTQLDAYNFDPANPDPTLDMIIAEAQGLTQPKASEYKTFKPDQGIYRAGPQGLEVVREPQIGASAGKPPSGYRYSQDGQSLEAIPGGPATKLGGDMVGRVAALQTAKENFDAVREFYLGGTREDGTVVEGQGTMDRINQLANRGTAGRVERNVSLAIEAALRAMTGAAAPESEVQNYVNIFGPSALDTPATIKDKLDRLESFMANVEANIAQGRGTSPGAPSPTGGASPFPEYPNARQAQDGNWYVEQNGQYFRIDQ